VPWTAVIPIRGEQKTNVTPAQIAWAWDVACGRKPWMVSLPGHTNAVTAGGNRKKPREAGRAFNN